MARHGVRLSLALACTVSLTSQARPAAQAPAAVWTPELMMTVKRVSSVVPSPDGTQVAFVVAEAAMEGEKSEWLGQIHLAAADGSNSRQITRGDKSSTEPRWSPDGQWIGFVSSRGGKANVWRIAVSGGEAEPVTDEKGSVHVFDWSPDGTRIAFVMTDAKSDAEDKAAKEKRDWRTIDENVKMRRLHVAPVEKAADGTRKARALTDGQTSVGDFSWSPDNRAIAFDRQKTPSTNDWPTGDLAEVTVDDGRVKTLAAGPAAESSPLYSPDGRSIAFLLSDNPPSWAGDERVAIVPADGGQARTLGLTPDAQPRLVGWSADGTRLILAETQGVMGRVLALPVDGGPAVGSRVPR